MLSEWMTNNRFDPEHPPEIEGKLFFEEKHPDHASLAFRVKAW